jgi:hypothetical protein
MLLKFRRNTNITKLCRQQAPIIQNHGNSYIENIGQGVAQNGKDNGLNFVAVKHMTVQVNTIPL